MHCVIDKLQKIEHRLINLKDPKNLVIPQVEIN